MAQAVALKKINILERAGKQGTDLIIDFLFGWKTVKEISRELRDSGHHTTDGNVRKHLEKYRDDYENKKPKGIELITSYMVKTRLSEIQKEFQKAMIADPIMVLHKNIYELEQMKSENNEFRAAGSILELQSKFAAQLAKIVPPEQAKYDINQLLERNDLGINFIVQIDLKHPELNLKDEFLEFVRLNSSEA